MILQPPLKKFQGGPWLPCLPLLPMPLISVSIRAYWKPDHRVLDNKLFNLVSKKQKQKEKKYISQYSKQNLIDISHPENMVVLVFKLNMQLMKLDTLPSLEVFVGDYTPLTNRSGTQDLLIQKIITRGIKLYYTVLYRTIQHKTIQYNTILYDIT